MKNAFLSLLALSVVGCASITNDVTHPMKVETITQDGKAIPGADCTFTNDFATTSGKSGGTVMVRRSSKDLDIACTAPGNQPAAGRAISRANGGMAGNILFGGGIGAIIDHNKGTAYTYPTWVRLVFGQTRIFDRREEKEGLAVSGHESGAVEAVVAAAQANTAAQPASAVMAGQQQPARVATGFAAIDDVDAIPYIGNRGRERYREWLTQPTPKAFAIAKSGHFGMAWGLKSLDTTLPSDPYERAVAVCERSAKLPCKLYALNGSVVWTKDAAVSSPAPAAN